MRLAQLAGLLDNYGRRFHEAKEARGRFGTKARAAEARAALVRYYRHTRSYKPGISHEVKR